MKQIDAIVLAAGLSRRMGAPKLLLPWRDGTVLGATLANVLASAVRQVVVVTGGYRLKVESVIQNHTPPLDSLRKTDASPSIVSTVHNPAFATGEMLSSLKVGLNALDQEVDGCLVVLGDMPLVTSATINLAVEALQTHALVAPIYEGRRGHPVGFGRTLFPQFLNLPPQGAPRDVIRAHRQQMHLIDVDTESVLIDLDTKEKYEQWRPR